MTNPKIERTLVVAVSHLLTQYQHLPPQWIAADGKTRIVATNDFRYVIDENNMVVKNSDLTILTDGATFISGGGTDSDTRRNNAHLEEYADGVHYMKRESKVAMTLRMAAVVRGLPEVKDFISPRIYSTQFADKRNSTFGSEIHGRVVVKPIDGARGIGQIVADMDKVTPAALMVLIKGAAKKEDFLTSLESLKPHVEYHIGHGDIDEGLVALAEQGFFVQEQVSNVVAEYRLILDHESKIALTFKRKRDTLPLHQDSNNFDHKQATGVTWFLDEAKPAGQYELSTVFNEVSTVLQELKIPLNSVDLFITADHKWGIFEYCPQYGTEGIDQKIMAPFLREQIERLLGIRQEGLHYMTPADVALSMQAVGIEVAERG